MIIDKKELEREIFSIFSELMQSYELHRSAFDRKEFWDFVKLRKELYYILSCDFESQSFVVVIEEIESDKIENVFRRV